MLALGSVVGRSHDASHRRLNTEDANDWTISPTRIQFWRFL
jgi:hypothetical protein